MSANNSPIFTWERRVEFAETDAAGIVHFSSFFVYMEQAEHALFRHCGWTIFPQKADDLRAPLYTWPRVHCSCDYKAPAVFEDILSIDVGIERMGTKSMTYRHLIRRGPQLIALGLVTSVCSKIDPISHQISSSVIPDEYRNKFQELIDASGSAPPSIHH
jgi:YbgC/YbaW family acyl-CoA thioester hydrolase